MPLHVTDDLEFVAGLDLQQLGPRTGEPTTHAWSWTSHLPFFLPWGLVLLALLLRENRTRVGVQLVLTALLASLPVALIELLGPGPLEGLDWALGAVVIAVALLFLLAPRLRRTGWPETLLFFLGVGLLAVLVSFLLQGGSPFVTLGTGAWFLASVMMVAIVIGLVVARFVYRRGGDPLRLGIWFALALVLLFALLSILLSPVLLVFAGGPIELLVLATLASLGGALLCFLPVFPFLILSALSPECHRRLQLVLHQPGA